MGKSFWNSVRWYADGGELLDVYWDGSGWYGIKEAVSTSMVDVRLIGGQHL